MQPGAKRFKMIPRASLCDCFLGFMLSSHLFPAFAGAPCHDCMFPPNTVRAVLLVVSIFHLLPASRLLYRTEILFVLAERAAPPHLYRMYFGQMSRNVIEPRRTIMPSLYSSRLPPAPHVT